MTKITAELSDEIASDLEVYASVSGCTLDELLREACYDFLQKMMTKDDRLKTLETANYRFRRSDLYRY